MLLALWWYFWQLTPRATPNAILVLHEFVSMAHVTNNAALTPTVTDEEVID